MLPWPPRRELKTRLPRVLFGLVLFGIGVALTVLADLGVSPWTVFHEGASLRTGLSLGTVIVITGIGVLLLWAPLGERLGIGTILNVVVIGPVIDLTLWIAPDTIELIWLQWVLLLSGILIVAVGSGFYIGSGLGPGPRDGVMTGLARRGFRIGVARSAIEASALVAGWFLGGTVGIGTVIFAFGVGPLIAFFLPRLTVGPLTPEADSDPAEHLL